MKRVGLQMAGFKPKVAPRAGAWIETVDLVLTSIPFSSRPPRGGVD